MYRHGRRDDNAELTIASFRRMVLVSLGKLNSKDTAKTGFDELNTLAERLNPQDESLGLFMNTILENTEKQTPLYKKESLKLAAVASTIHTDQLQQFLPKIMSAVTKNLKDRDSTVRESTVESLGKICLCVTPPDSKEPLNIYFKPLFQMLSEQNKVIQTGASMCISAVIKNSFEELVVSCLSKIVTRLQKHLSQPGCLAKSAIFGCFSTIVEATTLNSIPYIPHFLSSLIEGINAPDWADRRAAVDTIHKFYLVLRDAMLPFKTEIMQLLESAKFDKVKPVRDAVTVAYNDYNHLGGYNNSSHSQTTSLSSTGRSTFKKTSTVGSPLSEAFKNRPKSSKTKEIPHTIYEKSLSSTMPIRSSSEARKQDLSSYVRNYLENPSTNSIPDLLVTHHQEEAPTVIENSPQVLHPLNDNSPKVVIHPPQNQPNFSRSSSLNPSRNVSQPQSVTNSPRIIVNPSASRSSPHRSSPQLSRIHSSSTSPRSVPPHYISGSLGGPFESTSRLSQTFAGLNLEEDVIEEENEGQIGLTEVEQSQPQFSTNFVEQEAQENDNYQEHVDYQESQRAPTLNGKTTPKSTLRDQIQSQSVPKETSAPASNSTNVLLEQIMSSLSSFEKQQARMLEMFTTLDTRISRVEKFMQQQQKNEKDMQEEWQDELEKFPVTHLDEANSFSKPYVSPSMIRRSSILNSISSPTSSTIINNSTSTSTFTANQTSFSPNKVDAPWKNALDNAVIGYFEAAYAGILRDGDSIHLIRLMEKTGPVLERLEPATATELFMRLISFLKTHSFIDNVFPWIHQAVERAIIPLSVQQTRLLLRSLLDLSAMPNQQGIEAAQLHERIEKHVLQRPSS